MSKWKKFTGAVDSSAQSFLKHKKFSREKKKFTWDWHAWNLALVTTPSLLLGYYLHGVEERMEEEARIREEIQERTGVSSRGFLIPKKAVREEVQAMLSAGNQRKNATKGAEDDDGAEGIQQGQHGEEHRQENLPATLAAVHRRLAEIERVLNVEGDSSSTEEAGTDHGIGPSTNSTASNTSGSKQEMKSTSSTAHKVTDTSGTDRASWMSAVTEGALETASAAGGWVVEAGERHGTMLLQLVRDWLAEDKNRKDSINPENAGVREGRSVGDVTEQHAPRRNLAEVQKQEKLSVGKTLDKSSSSGSSTGDRRAAVSIEGDVPTVGGEKRAEEAWRRGSLSATAVDDR